MTRHGRSAPGECPSHLESVPVGGGVRLRESTFSGPRPQQFAPSRIDSDDIWDLLAKVTAKHRPEFDTAGAIGRGRTEGRVTPRGNKQITARHFASRSAMSPLSNDHIIGKFKALTNRVTEGTRQDAIVDCVTALDRSSRLDNLTALLAEPVHSPFDLARS